MQLIYNIMRVVLSNTITLVSNVVLGLILPIFLSVKMFGEYKLFLFYVGYIGVLHFGFIDAMYLKYGGLDKDLIDKQLLRKEHRVFFFYQLIIALIVFLGAFLLKNPLFILFSLTIIPSNVGVFHKLLFQATGQFKKYSNVEIAYTIINLSFISVLLFTKARNITVYILATVIAYLIIYIIMEMDFYRYTKSIIAKGKINILGYNKIGIFILVGNLCVMLITSIGSWIVQYFFRIEDFAYYSFSVSMMNMVLILINAVGLTFYNFISKKEDKDQLVLIKNILLVIGALAGSVYFILDLIIGLILPQYVIALKIIAISFTMFPYLMAINVIVTNIYKARKLERKYFKVVLSILFVGLILNGLAYLIFHSMNTIAFATLLSIIVWYVYGTCIEFKYLKGSKRELIFLGVHGVTFLVSANYFTWYTGLLIYFPLITLLSLLFYKENILKLFSKVKNKGPS